MDINRHFRGIAVKNVYLSNNELTTISFSLLPWEKLDTIKLDGNPWHCDCDLSWLVYKKNHTLISGIDYDYLICKSPEILADLPVKHLSRYNFGCSKSKSIIYMHVCYKFYSSIKDAMTIFFFLLGEPYVDMTDIALILLGTISIVTSFVLFIYINTCGKTHRVDRKRKYR